MDFQWNHTQCILNNSKSSLSEEADLGIVFDDVEETFDEEKFLADLGRMANKKVDLSDDDDSSPQKTKTNKSSRKQGKKKNQKTNKRISKIKNENLQQTFSDDTHGTAFTAKSVMSVWTIGTGFVSNASYLDEDLDHLLHRSDIDYVKRRFGVITLIVTMCQLLMLTMIISLCGFSTFSSNPCFGPYPDALSNAGAINPYLIEVQGQYWRYLTASFIPASIVHFFLNSLVQIEVGAYLERQWGPAKWLAIYLISGFGSVSFSCALENSDINVAG